MKNVYSIYDKKLATYGLPYCSDNDILAVRAFGGACRDQNMTVAMYPDCFDLYRIGTYDEGSSELKHITPEYVTSATAVINDFLQAAQAATMENVKKHMSLHPKKDG